MGDSGILGVHGVRGATLMLFVLLILTEVIEQVRARPWIWLFVIITLTSWPGYAAWCSHSRLTARLDDL